MRQLCLAYASAIDNCQLLTIIIKTSTKVSSDYINCRFMSILFVE
ncbi:hypothetical protein GGR21_000051 [Dysgonomonas hofstadii]|uniref:Uncharacterized protein n=1 Tax=Dysgonomonas hofstadii TaxID=637886 RepID=A0A840CG63_9BACT|nr:hypothetical protein [Dysgonomonas hofstadii]